MEVNEFSVAGDASGKTTPIIKPTTEIAKIISNEFLKILELTEHCNSAETSLNKWYKKVQKLTSSKNDSVKIFAEYKNRNKINVINSESLLQALNELYKYKSELKFNYLATEKAIKAKKLKYKKVLSSYESSWEKAVKEYSADPVFEKLNEIQKENALLEEKLEKQKELNACTEIQFIELKKDINKKLVENIIEFSKVMTHYKQYLTSAMQNENEFHKLENSKKMFKLFQESSQCNKNTLITTDVNEDVNYTCSIDVSVFDEIMVPTENLESQNLEEEGYSFVQNDGQQTTDTSKEEALEYINNYQQTIQSKTTEKEGKEVKTGEENESEYFRPQNSDKQPSKEQWKCAKEKSNIAEDLKTRGNATGLQQPAVEEEPPKDMQMECEESLSDGSYEKHMANNKESWPLTKTPSVSSEDFQPAADNPNESGEPGNKACDEGSFFKPSDSEKNDFKTFNRFFMMGSDQDTSKPSIFKLF